MIKKGGVYTATMNKNDIPSPPEKPSANECCGSGCVPCIYDYYYDAYEKWQAEHGEAYQAQQKALKESLNSKPEF